MYFAYSNLLICFSIILWINYNVKWYWRVCVKKIIDTSTQSIIMVQLSGNNSTMKSTDGIYYTLETTFSNQNDTFKSYNQYEYEEEDEYIFDRTYIKIIFIFMYSIVFCLCFFGKLVKLPIYLFFKNMSIL